MDNNGTDTSNPFTGKRPQRQGAKRGTRPARLRVKVSKTNKGFSTSPINKIPPRKASLRSSKGNKEKVGASPRSPLGPKIPIRKSSLGKTGRAKEVLEKLAAESEQRRFSKTTNSSGKTPGQAFLEQCRRVSLDDKQGCNDLRHKDDEMSHATRLDRLAELASADRLARAKEIFLRDNTARPITALGLPSWSSSTMREMLYNGNLSNDTSKIVSPTTRAHFLDWQSEIDIRNQPCWHGVDMYNLNPHCREARVELTQGVPRRVTPYHEGLRLLERRPTLDILTAAERDNLVKWWEDYYGREVTTPIERKFPWARFGERHYLQRKAKQAEKERNQDLYDMGLLSPGTAATLREYGKLHADYESRKRKLSLALSRYPTQESKLTTRTW